MNGSVAFGAVVVAGWVALLILAGAQQSVIVGRRRSALLRLRVVGAAPLGRRHRPRIDAEVVRALPDLVDLFELAVGGGLNVRLALDVVAARAPPPVRPAIDEAARLAADGVRTADALARLPDRLGEAVRPLVSVLLASERYGTPLLPALERVAVDARARRRVAADEAARRVPVKLLFPLVLCILPAFALLTVVPLLAGALRSLRL